MGTCTRSKPTIYNPNSNSRLEGGGRNRFRERINSMEDAARNGRPVTVAMDWYGTFGKTCNRVDRRCYLLVHTPGLDKYFPDYGKKFPNLPKDSFLAVVEDTGGAFEGKGTGKIDVPFRSSILARRSWMTSARFEVLKDLGTASSKRYHDHTHYRAFINGNVANCEGTESIRRLRNSPLR